MWKKQNTIKADRIEARNFVLVDSKGNERASLLTSDGNDLVAYLKTSDGAMRVLLTLQDSGSTALVFTAENSGASLTVGVTADGVPTIRLEGQAQVSGLSLSVDPEGRSRLGMSDSRGRERLVAGMGEGEMAIGCVKDASGNVRVSLSVTKEGISDVILGDNGGNVRVNMHMEQDGTSVLRFLNESGSETYSIPFD